jgi:hypothetical protein
VQLSLLDSSMQKARSVLIGQASKFRRFGASSAQQTHCTLLPGVRSKCRAFAPVHWRRLLPYKRPTRSNMLRRVDVEGCPLRGLDKTWSCQKTNRRTGLHQTSPVWSDKLCYIQQHSPYTAPQASCIATQG